MENNNKSGGSIPITAKILKGTKGGIVDPLLNVGSVAQLNPGVAARAAVKGARALKGAKEVVKGAVKGAAKGLAAGAAAAGASGAMAGAAAGAAKGAGRAAARKKAKDSARQKAKDEAKQAPDAATKMMKDPGSPAPASLYGGKLAEGLKKGMSEAEAKKYAYQEVSSPTTMMNAPGSQGSMAPIGGMGVRFGLSLAKRGAKYLGRTGVGRQIKSKIASFITPKAVKEVGKKGGMVLYGSKPLYNTAGKVLNVGKKIGNFVLGGKSILGRAASYGAFGVIPYAVSKLFGGGGASDIMENKGGQGSRSGGGSRKRVSYDTAYKNRSKSYSWMDKDTYIKEAKRQNEVFKRTGKWDYKNAPKQPKANVVSNVERSPGETAKPGLIGKPETTKKPNVVKKPDLTPGTNKPNMNLSQKEENTIIRKNKAYDKKQAKIDKARAAGNEKKALRKEKSLRNKKRRNINKASKNQASKAIKPNNNASFDPNEFLM